jgi:S-adenosylmethionine:tRNA-ribosyltransferase-isomerase (queuine synthetase)
MCEVHVKLFNNNASNQSLGTHSFHNLIHVATSEETIDFKPLITNFHYPQRPHLIIVQFPTHLSFNICNFKYIQGFKSVSFTDSVYLYKLLLLLLLLLTVCSFGEAMGFL